MSLITCGDIDGFEDFLFEKTDGFIHAWDQYLADEAYDYVDRWLTENPFCKIERKFIGCGDCEICKVMANTNGNFSALMEAFATEQVMASVTKQLQNNPETQKVGSHVGRNMQNVLTFKVSLNGSRPLIWRRIIVPDNFTFFDLHCAIQNAMGWSDSHLHQFKVSHPKKGQSVKDSTKVICLPNPDWDDEDAIFETFNEKNEYLVDWFGTKIQQCVYEYDFGDSWLHTVLLESSTASESDKLYPICTSGKMACPPDDCGGLPGYERIKKILKNKKHPEYKDVCDWLLIENGEEFDPSAFNPNTVEFDDPVDIWKEDQDFR
jgi:hypothetical protein